MATHAHDEENVQSNAQVIHDLRGSSSTGIRPVTIQQLLNATRPHSGARFQIDEIEVDRVSTVAHVARVRTFPTVVFYDLEDGTGCITAKQWLSDIVDALPEDHSGFYVRIVGQIIGSSSATKNALSIHQIHKVITEAFHQVCFHLAEAVFVTLSHERGPPPPTMLFDVEPRFMSNPPTPLRPPRSPSPSPERPATTASRLNHTAESPMSPSRWQPIPDTPTPTRYRSFPNSPPDQSPHQPAKSATAAETSSPAGSSARARSPVSPTPAKFHPRTKYPNKAKSSSSGPSDMDMPVAQLPQKSSGNGSRRVSGIKRDPYADLTVLQRAIILQVLDVPYSDTGVDVGTIAKGVRHHNVTAEQIDDALDFLLDEGFIENTVNESHFVVSAGKTSRYPVPS